MIARLLAAPALIIIALIASACPIAGGSPRRVGDIIRDTDAAMARAGAYQVDGDISFDVSVLPDAGHVTGHADVVQPDSYVIISAGPYEERLLVRDGVTYTSSQGEPWQRGSATVTSPSHLVSPYGETAALLALEVFGDFESRQSDRPGDEQLRYTLSIDRTFEIEKTIIGIVIPEADGVLDLAGIGGTIDFDFYVDARTHLIDEIVIGGKAKAIGIPVTISGSIQYHDYGSTSITLPDPGDTTSATAGGSPPASLTEAG